MNKAQLIEALTTRLDGNRRAASAAVEGVVDIVVRTVESGENVTITGFGVFEKRSRAARVARNPRTGETVLVAPTSVPAFRPGAQFKDVVSGAATLPADAPAVKRAASRPTTPAKAPAKTAAKAPAKSPAKTPASSSAGPKTAAAKSAVAKTKDKPAKAEKSDKKKKAKAKK